MLARLTYDRMRGLHDRDSATRAELDQATALLAGAEARVAGATARVAEAEQGIAAAQAGADAASVGASYTVLTAPFDAIVSARHADPGTLAAPGQALLTLDDATAYRLEARIDESHARLVSVGADADVRLDNGTDDRERWRRVPVVEVASLDPTRHSFLVKLDLPAGLPEVRSGQFGRVRLRGPARRVLAGTGERGGPARTADLHVRDRRGRRRAPAHGVGRGGRRGSRRDPRRPVSG